HDKGLEDLLLSHLDKERHPSKRELYRRRLTTKYRSRRYLDSIRGIVSDHVPAGWTLEDHTKQKVLGIVQPVLDWLDKTEPDMLELRNVEAEVRGKLRPLIGWVVEYAREWPAERGIEEEDDGVGDEERQGLVHDEL
ncbi:hypothetical protein HK104_003381, partial [Borealophlyctis nickersoniae]